VHWWSPTIQPTKKKEQLMYRPKNDTGAESLALHEQEVD
jgi:hypothetical protein